MCSTLEYPDNFLCPITCDIMDDPVTAKDGHTYNRSAIQRWFDEGRRSSPVTNAVMLSTDLVPNYSMKSQISSWRDQNETPVRESNTTMNPQQLWSLHGCTGASSSVTVTSIGYQCGLTNSHLTNL